MSTYEVTLQQTLRRTVCVTVEADNDLDASDAAEAVADFSDAELWADELDVLEVEEL